MYRLHTEVCNWLVPYGACGHGNVQQHSLFMATMTFILQQTAKQHFLEVE